MLRTIGFRLNNAVSNFEYKIVLLSSGARMQETVDFSYYKVLLRTVFFFNIEDLKYRYLPWLR